jgi:hypothetical protein
MGIRAQRLQHPDVRYNRIKAITQRLFPRQSSCMTLNEHILHMATMSLRVLTWRRCDQGPARERREQAPSQHAVFLYAATMSLSARRRCESLATIEIPDPARARAALMHAAA